MKPVICFCFSFAKQVLLDCGSPVSIWLLETCSSLSNTSKDDLLYSVCKPGKHTSRLDAFLASIVKTSCLLFKRFSLIIFNYVYGGVWDLSVGACEGHGHQEAMGRRGPWVSGGHQILLELEWLALVNHVTWACWDLNSGLLQDAHSLPLRHFYSPPLSFVHLSFHLCLQLIAIKQQQKFSTKTVFCRRPLKSVSSQPRVAHSYKGSHSGSQAFTEMIVGIANY